MVPINRDFIEKNEKEFKKIKELHLLAIIVGLDKFAFIRRISESKNGRRSIQIHELPIMLMLNIGFLYEALDNYDYIKGHVKKSKSFNEDETFKEHVIFLNSTKANEFKRDALRIARNEGAFHNDILLIVEYISSRKDDNPKAVWSRNELGELYSPTAYEILLYSLRKNIKMDPEQAGVFMGELAEKLLYVATRLSNEWS